jgi:peptidyl-prolyl cis-trans isomerase SurA
MTLSVTPRTPAFRVFLAGIVLSALAVASLPAPGQAAQPITAPAPASPFGGAVVEESVAQVNDQIITLSDYERAEQQMEADGRQQGWSDQEMQEQKRELLRDLIDKELLLSKGKELNITGETELVKRLDEIRKQNHLDSMEDLEKAAQEQGVSYEDFKQKIRNEIIIQQVTRQEVASKIHLTKAEVDAYFRAHQAEFNTPETVHLVEILIPVGDDAASLAAAQQKAADIESKLKNGASFEEIAKQESSGPTAATGGELGDYKRGQLPKPIEDAAFSLQPGQSSAPIRTKQGLLILKATQHSGGGAENYATVEPQVEEAVFMDRMQPELRKYLTTLRSQAYLDIRPGYVDAGASSSTIKPLFSAYTPPGKKKKEKVERMRYREAAHSFRNKTAPAQTASATTPSAPGAVTAPTTGVATATATQPTTKTTPVAANSLSTKPVKKQKVRYGQAPSGTLDDASANSMPVPATASGAANSETQVASNVSSNITGPGIATAQTVAEKKTRYAARAREPKRAKAETQDQLENQAQGKATPEEQATRQTQSAPLGLAGDTATKKKQPKPKSDEKTRYADKPKASPDGDSNPTTPSDSAPPATAPAPPATSPTPSSPPQ